MKFLRQVLESFRFAWQALKSNITRTILSLLGVTVGIFAIVAVFTIVDSLERSIKDSMSFIGDKVIYVQKWPWGFGGEYQWWKYFQWPEPTFAEYKFLYDNLESASAVAVMDFRGSTTLKNGSNSIVAQIQGVSYEYNQISDIPIQDGRYFIPLETNNARNVAIVGADIAAALFPGQDAVGKAFKLAGNKFTIVGVQVRKGESLVDFGGSPDKNCIIPFASFSKLFQSGRRSADIVVKGFPEDEGMKEVEAEITGLMRTKRGIKPRDGSNFSLNRPEAAAEAIGQLFAVLTIAGWVIGSFSILVGGFGIANIMFVSVKERTNLIGIQKSLGAKNYSILFQFLFEAVMLSLVGGLVGIFLVFLLSFMPMGSLQILLTPGNIILGLGVSSIIGVLSGIVPAMLAARMDPVIAIRAK
ncbi:MULTISPECIES: ABC transporter permease [Dyadobacter]|uniref:ABC transporter permease n=1 Tax=Dyadobacter chenhuakuii TaxID=2909339 RepID=A0A9X1U1Y3_9BACT|nr:MULTISPECIES: ABC transporter permease [Dyadobacter]MCE7068793.1 ABC transporter permease [Dyadobacter sp. CY327]MCF2495693.1 ABC transporter permease [Dyadobacter chenhuakuii]MCF2499856.1 ABC transporter permease [Dyadobacter chenhuakuii]MCF2520100.1 ABC transporter permease [Dyadobacter sp. CY351]USJ29726.1 ABC transporter permease [Dyadobacter chenhuakuii]